MYAKINRDLCTAQLAFCERCLGHFLTHPLGYERRCFEILDAQDDDILNIDLHTENHDVSLTLDAEQRRLLAGEGWSAFVNFDVPLYRDNNAA